VSGPPRFQDSQQFRLLFRSLDVKGHIGFGSYGGSDRWFPTALVGAEESIWQKLEEPESSLGSPPCHIIDEERLKIWLKLREKNEVRMGMPTPSAACTFTLSVTTPTAASSHAGTKQAPATRKLGMPETEKKESVRRDSPREAVRTHTIPSILNEHLTDC
jgi:hypothetical protein